MRLTALLGVTSSLAVVAALLGSGMTAATAAPANQEPLRVDTPVAFGLIVHDEPGARALTSPSAQSRVAATVASVAGANVTSIDGQTLPGSTVYRFDRPVPVSSAKAAVSTLRLTRSATRAEPDVLISLLRTPEVPNDPKFSDQWFLWDGGGARDFSIEAPLGWEYSKGSDDIVVAVLDTGWTDHPDLANAVVNGYDFVSVEEIANDGDGRDRDASDPGDWITASEASGVYNGCAVMDSSWHGTHVAGIVAAEQNNRKGVSGVAPDSRVLAVRVIGKCGGLTSDIAAAIRWASGERISGVPVNETPAQVINMSLGSIGSCGTAFRRAVESAQSRGTVVVAAAGNEGRPVSDASPANCPGVISVVATNPSGTRTGWSNYGTNRLGVGMAAPGESILSTLNNGRRGPGSPTYERASGTSMASPVVAGAVALLMSMGVKADDIPDALGRLVKPFPSRGGGEVCSKTECGPGLLDLSRLELFAADPPPNPDPAPEPEPEPGPDPGPVPLTIPGLIDDVKVRYSFSGSTAKANINWAHTEGAQRSIYYLWRLKRGGVRWTKWTRQAATSVTVARLPRNELSFLEIRGVNELGKGLVYQVTLLPKR